MSLPDVMIDIETLSLRVNATIATIGALKFDRRKIVIPALSDTFYKRIDLKSSEELKLDKDPATVDWWRSQPKESREEIFSLSNRFSLSDILTSFSEWFGDSTYIWSHGATFDIPRMEGYYDLLGIPTPWKFYNARDTRTLFDLANVRINGNATHNALDDCYRQLGGVKLALEKLKIY